MIGTTGIVSHCDRGPGAQENTASIDDVFHPVLCVRGVDDEMLWCIPALDDTPYQFFWKQCLTCLGSSPVTLALGKVLCLALRRALKANTQ